MNQILKQKLVVGKNSYDISVLNISGTSFGAISPPAITSLNKAAKMGGFAHNTEEKVLYLLTMKMVRETQFGKLTGYFGCRDKKGNFDPKAFEKKAKKDQVKMIEIKLSQGAKPGHGGMLLAPKVTQEIAETRGIETNQDCISPAKHSEFNNPAELLKKFVEKLRKISVVNLLVLNYVLGNP